MPCFVIIDKCLIQNGIFTAYLQRLTVTLRPYNLNIKTQSTVNGYGANL